MHKPCSNALQEKGLDLDCIEDTHHHPDHIEAHGKIVFSL